MRHASRWRDGLVAMGLLLLVLGCGSEPIGTAAGKVTYKGAPVAEGSVEFSNSESGLTYLADLQNDGSFKFELNQGAGVPPGTYAVAIQPPRIKPGLGYIPPNKNAGDYPNIPRKYRSSKSSGFSATVKAGNNEPLAFDMN
jgi:hypothetical protein